MLKPLEQWLTEDVSKVKDKSVKWLSEQYFHREVTFSKKINNSVMYSPASGVIMNVQPNIGGNDVMVEVKGVKYTLNELYGDFIDIQEEDRFLLLDIYLTFYDEHFQSIPYSGYLYSEELPPVKSMNMPMLAVEKDILQGVINPEARMGYLMDNGRMINTINSIKLQDEYYVTQIADFDVSKILNYKEGIGEYAGQCERFGKITLGSEVQLIVRHSDLFNLEFFPDVQVGMHVDRTDPIVKINWK